MMNQVVDFIENIMQRIPPSKLQNDVMVRTGPVVFTKAILSVIEKYGIPSGTNKSGYPNSLPNFHPYATNLVTLTIPVNISENNNTIIQSNKTIQGVILGRNAFGTNPQLTKHHFHGKWKGKEGKVNEDH